MIDKILVSAEPLRKLLIALNGNSYEINELRVVDNLARMTGQKGVIETLTSEYNAALEADHE